MFRKITTSVLLGATLIGGLAVPAEAKHRHYRYEDRGRSGYAYAGGRRCYDKGNGGLAIGAIAGGLLGNAVAGRGDKTLGTVLGAAGGGLLGRSIDRSDGRPC